MDATSGSGKAEASTVRRQVAGGPAQRRVAIAGARTIRIREKSRGRTRRSQRPQGLDRRRDLQGRAAPTRRPISIPRLRLYSRLWSKSARAATCRRDRADAWRRRACRLARHDRHRPIVRRAERYADPRSRVQGHHRATERRHRRAQDRTGRGREGLEHRIDASDATPRQGRARAGRARHEGRQARGNRQSARTPRNDRAGGCRAIRAVARILAIRATSPARSRYRALRRRRTRRACPSFKAGSCNGSSTAPPSFPAAKA